MGFSKPIVTISLFLFLSYPALSQDNASPTLQRHINRLMADKAGVVVLMDVASGNILAQRNINVAARRLEFPGSTVKPFVLMELLNSGKVKPEQKLMCRRPLYIGGRRMDCSHPAGITSLDAR